MSKMHPDVKAWRKWIGSDEGLECLKPGAEGQYLRNRLKRAFMAGQAAEREMMQQAMTALIEAGARWGMKLLEKVKAGRSIAEAIQKKGGE